MPSRSAIANGIARILGQLLTRLPDFNAPRAMTMTVSAIAQRLSVHLVSSALS